jgi:hypothetical protein
MSDFKTIPLKSMAGAFNTLASADAIGFGNWRIVKNAVSRSSKSRQRGGGWRRLFADADIYNNQDLHDQLTDRLFYYEEFEDRAVGGGDLAGYVYPYFAASSAIPGAVVFPPASGPFCPVYVGDFPTGNYDGCPIFYQFVGFPYSLVGGNVRTINMFAHWRLDEVTGPSSRVDEINGINLSATGSPVGTTGKLGGAVEITNTSNYLSSTSSQLRGSDITFGFHGWVNFNAVSNNAVVLGIWDTSGSFQVSYRLVVSGSSLRFEVSPDGTIGAAVGITSPIVISAGAWYFVSCWHDASANTVNIKINDGSISSVSHTGGVWNSSLTFALGLGFLSGVASNVSNAKLDSWTFWRNGFPIEPEIGAIYNSGAGDEYPFAVADGCDTGYPFYYAYSYLYTSCPTTYPDTPVAGYPYGTGTPFYGTRFDYDYTYCGTGAYQRNGCREAVTMLNEVVVASGRKLIAATMSRVYELNQSAGNWRLLADGLGNSGYTVNQCGCNSVRGMSATLGSYLIYTNNLDAPSIYTLGDDVSGCALQGLQTITDLTALGVTKAGGVVTWKGFTIFYDITEDGERMGGTVLWSDLDDPNSLIESDTSFAGRATIAIGETILNAAPLGNWLIIYTDKSIIRVTLVGGEDVFNFENIYKGGNALKYKFSLINCGDQHIYLGESDIYAFTQFDTRPINYVWITEAAGFIFNGIAETDAEYGSINKDACDLVTGGWSDEKREAWLSWPTGSNTCPNVSLRLNLKYNAADFVDHGFTSFLTFRADDRPTVGQWIEDLGICARGTKVAVGPKDGSVCTGSSVAVANPPLYIRNPTENPDLPVHADSLCARLSGKTIEDYCRDCAVEATFITASASDFTLKQQEDDVYYRQMLGGNIEAYDGYSCHGEFYHNVGYDTVFQEGANDYRTDDEKMIKMIGIEAEPLPQSTPSNLECEIGYASTPSCFTWKTIRPLEFACQSNKTAAQHITDKTRPDGTFYFPTFRRGRFLSARFRISGIGGGGTFSAMQKMIKDWGQVDSP